MILLWLLCVGLVLGGLVASLARQIPWSTLRFQRTRIVPVLAPAPRVGVRLLARGLGGRILSLPDIGSRAGPPRAFGCGGRAVAAFRMTFPVGCPVAVLSFEPRLRAPRPR